MFFFNWLFNKLGYMPKSDCVDSTVEIESLDKEPKPFTRQIKKPVVKRASTRKAKK
jgi:hypothetical protein